MLRSFEHKDQSQVRALILSGLSERWGTDYNETYNPDLDDITRNYVNNGADVVVIEEAGIIAATGMLLREHSSNVRIVRMSVSRTHRRQGLGHRVVEELLARARLHGAKEVSVLTDTIWFSAVAFYKACGFTETGQDDVETHFTMML